MTTHSSIRAWRIPWTENPGGPWGCKELATTEQLRLWLHTFHTCYKIYIYSLTQMIWNHLQCLTISFLTSELIVDFLISVTYWVVSFPLRSGCFSVIWIQHNITKWFQFFKWLTEFLNEHSLSLRICSMIIKGKLFSCLDDNIYETFKRFCNVHNLLV